MTARIHEWAGLTLAMALAAGCGDGGPGAVGGAIPPGPALGQNPGFGARQESPGRGFDEGQEQPEDPGHGLETPGQTPGGGGGGGPGQGDGDGGPKNPGDGGAGGSDGLPGGGGDVVALCMQMCARVMQECSVEANCDDECSDVAEVVGHPCESAVKTALQCSVSASSFNCQEGNYSPVGCDQQLSASKACLSQGG